MTKKSQNQTAIDIISRLPLLRQLNDSQSNLLSITPAWLAWSNNELASECADGCQLSSLINGKLLIVCRNATFASQIKHQQQNLQNSLNDQGAEIEQIIVRIQTLPQNSKHNISDNQSDANSTRHQHKPSENALKAINNCQKTVGNVDLANSLARLARTLDSENLEFEKPSSKNPDIKK